VAHMTVNQNVVRAAVAGRRGRQGAAGGEILKASSSSDGSRYPASCPRSQQRVRRAGFRRRAGDPAVDEPLSTWTRISARRCGFEIAPSRDLAITPRSTSPTTSGGHGDLGPLGGAPERRVVQVARRRALRASANALLAEFIGKTNLIEGVADGTAPSRAGAPPARRLAVPDTRRACRSRSAHQIELPRGLPGARPRRTPTSRGTVVPRAIRRRRGLQVRDRRERIVLRWPAARRVSAPASACSRRRADACVPLPSGG